MAKAPDEKARAATPTKKAPARAGSSMPAIDSLAARQSGTTAPTYTATGGARPANDHALVSGGPFWGNPDATGYAQQNIVTVTVGGVSVQVNAGIATQTMGFLRDLIASGYRPRSVQGFNNRNITGGTGKSNHAYGAAFDIDPDVNPRVVGGTAKSALEPNIARNLAAKWGFFWGGDYKKSKDYMHFEALGAPRTPGAPKGGAAPVITPAAKAAGATGPVSAPGTITGPSSTMAGGRTAAPGGTAVLPDAPPGRGASDAEVRKYAEAHYGMYAIYLHDKEVGPLLFRLARSEISDAEFESKLKATKFWKTHDQSQRSWDYLNSNDPATAKAKVQATVAEITTAAQSNGITLTGLQIHDLAVTANRNGWNPQQTLAAMKAHGKLDPTKVKSDYGKYTALAATNPEIKGLLDQATKNNWSPQQFEQAVQGSKWYTTTTPAQRDLQLAQATDPAGATEARSKAHDKVNQAATNLGVPLTPAVIALADQAFENGWTDDEINRKLADLVQVNPQGGNTGQTAVTLAALKSQARSYLVPISDATLSSWVTQIQRGDVPPASFEAYLKEQAKSLFPGMKGAIDAGVTPEQYVNPYRELAAQTLELNPQDIDFLDPKWSGALFQQGQDGTRTSMSLADWQNSLRRRPEYTKTRGAQTQAAALTESITKMFGKVSA